MRGKMRIGTERRRYSQVAAIAVATLALAFPLPTLSQETESIPAASSPSLGALTIRRNATESELRELARTLSDARARTEQLEQSIAGIEKTTTGMRDALVESATKRKELERQVIENEDRLRDLGAKETDVKVSLRSRRGLLAEVLAALQRMGRNPPPALLVSPDDALSSVRSAILLGAVVPGIRGETEKLAADLEALSKLRQEIASQRETYVKTMASAMEEEQKMTLLAAENDKLNVKNRAELDNEKKRAEELATRATSLEGLISSLEKEISSVKSATDAAKAEEERRAKLAPAERERLDADTAMPDKNRIAPAYAFSSLKGKLELPVAGDVLRMFGEDDGTGHGAKELAIATKAGMVVTAPSDGWVVYAGAFRSYGHMVIMNTGDGFMIVMTGMDAVRARQGQFVVAGEPLGQMGDKKIASAAGLHLETDRPTLYIEFRKDGTPVDSKPWWSVKDLGKARNAT
jgi:septal ring factor EnvC (AmiA/AmiB activator)